MIIQPFSGEAADIDYLLKNPTAKILLGNPDQIAGLIRCCPYARRFTSFALSFNERLSGGNGPKEPGGGAVLSLQLLLPIVTTFLDFTAPGGQRARLSCLAVIHEDKGRTEVHILVVNVDLATGRQYSPYVHRRDSARLRNFQKVINVSHGFTDPEDLDVQLRSTPNPRTRHYTLIRKITESVQNKFEAAAQVTADDVADFLESAGYRVRRKSREGKNRRLAVLTDDGGEVRLPGVWFRADFDLAKFRDKKRQGIRELKRELARRAKRFKELTARSHRMNRTDAPMVKLPSTILVPNGPPFFSRLFPFTRWEGLKIQEVSESLFLGPLRRAEWLSELSSRLRFPIIDVQSLPRIVLTPRSMGTPKTQTTGQPSEPNHPEKKTAPGPEGPR